MYVVKLIAIQWNSEKSGFKRTTIELAAETFQFYTYSILLLSVRVERKVLSVCIMSRRIRPESSESSPRVLSMI